MTIKYGIKLSNFIKKVKIISKLTYMCFWEGGSKNVPAFTVYFFKLRRVMKSYKVCHPSCRT